VVTDAASLEPTATVPAPGADAVAVSAGWLAWRADDALYAVPLADPAAEPRRLARGGVGRPALGDGRLVYHRASATRSRLYEADLASGNRPRTLRSTTGALLLNPSALGGELLFVRSSRAAQQLRLVSGGRDRIVMTTTPTGRRDAGREPGQGRHRHGSRVPRQPARPPAGLTYTLWTTALARDAAYVTRLRARKGGGAQATLLRVGR